MRLVQVLQEVQRPRLLRVYNLASSSLQHRRSQLLLENQYSQDHVLNHSLLWSLWGTGAISWNTHGLAAHISSQTVVPLMSEWVVSLASAQRISQPQAAAAVPRKAISPLRFPSRLLNVIQRLLNLHFRNSRRNALLHNPHPPSRPPRRYLQCCSKRDKYPTLCPSIQPRSQTRLFLPRRRHRRGRSRRFSGPRRLFRLHVLLYPKTVHSSSSRKGTRQQSLQHRPRYRIHLCQSHRQRRRRRPPDTPAEQPTIGTTKPSKRYLTR